MYGQTHESYCEVGRVMCSGMNHKRIDSIREQELRQRLADALANDKSHTKEMSKN